MNEALFAKRILWLRINWIDAKPLLKGLLLVTDTNWSDNWILNGSLLNGTDELLFQEFH